jgi:hypothetical protein
MKRGYMASTPVIFRKSIKTGELVALFPDKMHKGCKAWYATCLAFEGYGFYSYNLDQLSKTIAPHCKEYQPLVKKLEALGYDLEIIKRFQAAHMIERKRIIDNGN